MLLSDRYSRRDGHRARTSGDAAQALAQDPVRTAAQLLIASFTDKAVVKPSMLAPAVFVAVGQLAGFTFTRRRVLGSDVVADRVEAIAAEAFMRWELAFLAGHGMPGNPISSGRLYLLHAGSVAVSSSNPVAAVLAALGG